MNGAELVFFVFAALAVAGAGTMLFARDPRRVIAGFMSLFLALAGLHVLLVAPVVAVVHVLVGAALVTALAPVIGGLMGAPRAIGRRGLFLAGAALAVIAFVMLGTLARQYVSYGAELDVDPDFGSFARIAADSFGRQALALDVVGLILMVAVLAVVISGRRTADVGGGEGGSA